MKPKFGCFVFFLVSIFCAVAESKCSKECGRALASYLVPGGSDLTYITTLLQSSLNIDPDTIVSYNKEKIPNKDSVQQNITINVPFPCQCVQDSFLGYVFNYSLQSKDTYDTVAQQRIPDVGTMSIPVNCSCGNSAVSKEFGLFATYPLRPGDTLELVAAEAGLNSSYTTLLQSYNPGVNFSQGSGVVYIPGKEVHLAQTISSERPFKPPATIAASDLNPSPLPLPLSTALPLSLFHLLCNVS
ncbi:hypothetical protein CIPAW_04G112500 [Carya illinoinensis]|uniref:LYK3/RLK10-like LysM domain-containing protein n=1 Tax=Carya illinoinensis TaxID=32201 RepID=A0A8T1QT96_CARIL|nr:hypothetical protein CIPAW_04G112500 [Carya illinoinensis]